MPNYDNYIFKSSIFKSVVKDAVSFFSTRPLLELPLTESFTDSGVYGLYHSGNSQIYHAIVEKI